MKKIRRFITSLALVLTLCITAVTPVFAATNPWWSETGRTKNYVCRDLRMYNDNLTPVKNLSFVTCRGDSRFQPTHRLTLYCSAKRADSTNIPIEVHMQVRDADTHAVLENKTVVIPEGGTEKSLSVAVFEGQRIQVYFDICSQYYNPNRNYRAAYITYAYTLN